MITDGRCNKLTRVHSVTSEQCSGVNRLRCSTSCSLASQLRTTSDVPLSVFPLEYGIDLNFINMYHTSVRVTK